MRVKASVFERVPRFRDEGSNRWGEFIFSQEARRSGARVAIVDHYVLHAGSGTKANRDTALANFKASLIQFCLLTTGVFLDTAIKWVL